MRDRIGGLLPALALTALGWACFARLAAAPGHLIVDGQRPSLDDTLRGESRTVGNDLTRLFLPLHLRIGDRFARFGHWPKWDPAGFGGRPIVGNPQASLWYPPVWLVWWSRAPAALGWLTVAHLLWGGLGTYGLVRTLGLNRWAATVAGACFQASPYVLSQTFEGHYPHIWAASWMPWAFWAAIGMRRGVVRATLALPVVLALAFLTGHPQEWYYLMLALGAWALVDLHQAAQRGQRGWAFRIATVWGLVLALTLGLMAIELVPDLSARAWTLRSGRMSMKHASHYHLNPLNILQLLTPRALGGPADYFGHDNYWETVLSLGWTPLVLVALALTRSPRRTLVHGWAALTAAAVIFAAGRRLGLFALLYWLMPGMDQFRVPARSLFLATLGASVLAGLGIEALGHIVPDALPAWKQWGRGYRHWVTGLVGAVVLGHALAWWIGVDGEGAWAASKAALGRQPRLNRERELTRWIKAGSQIAHDPVFWLALGGTSVVIAGACGCSRGRWLAPTAIGFLAMAELGLQGHALIQTAPARQFLGPDPVSDTLARLQPPGPFRIRARDAFYDDLRASQYRFEKTNINDSFQIQHAADLYQNLYLLFRGPVPSLASTEPDDPEPEPKLWARRDVWQALLDRMGVAFLVTDRPEPEAPWPVAAMGRWNGVEFTIYRNPTALPRAYVVPRAEAVVRDDATSVALFPKIDPRQAVLMGTDPLGESGPRQAFTPARWLSDDPDRVIIEVETQAPGLLVVADTWMPGWSARVDGRSAPLLRGNHAQRVVPLRHAGHHKIEMTYTPPGLPTGLALTGLSAVVWLLLVAFALDHQRRARAGRSARTARPRPARPHVVSTAPFPLPPR